MDSYTCITTLLKVLVTIAPSEEVGVLARIIKDYLVEMQDQVDDADYEHSLLQGHVEELKKDKEKLLADLGVANSKARRLHHNLYAAKDLSNIAIYLVITPSCFNDAGERKLVRLIKMLRIVTGKSVPVCKTAVKDWNMNLDKIWLGDCSFDELPTIIEWAQRSHFDIMIRPRDNCNKGEEK